MQPDPTPEITPLARRLAEDAGVAWRTLSAAGGGPVTEHDVLEHLTETVKGGVLPDTGAKPEVDLGSLAASLTEVLQELLAEPEGEAETISENPVVEDAAPEPAAENLPSERISAREPRHLQAQLEVEQRAHAQTQRQLDELKKNAARQKTLVAQLKPLSAEIQRLGSALGVANAEMERLRPLEGLVGSLQKQLEEARADEARVRLLCRALQEQNDLFEEERRQRPRWQFWRRTS